MRHYTQSTYQQQKNKQEINKKALAIYSVASMLLEYLEYFNALMPFKSWAKDKKAIYYLNEDEYNTAQQIALKKFKSDATEVFGKLKMREKIVD